MALFGSRRRGSSAARQPLDANTAYAANVAARAAAAGSRPGTSSGLSSAAAAAALRSITSSPEPVGSIQTKRMVRRGSNASIGSASIMSGRGGAPTRGSMQRRGSQGSMTERTFRSPSPGRSRTNSFTNGPSSPVIDAPPVPSIPRSVQQRAHQRSSSVDPPQRVYSPTPNGRGARTSSMDRSTLPPPVSTRKGARLSDVHESELERSNSQRAGQNFSRPRNANASSPTSPTSPTAGKQYVHGTGAWHSEPVQNTPRTNGGTGPNAEDLAAKMSRIQGAQGQTVKRSNTNSSSQGAQLRDYTQPTITGTAVRPQARPQQGTETVMVYDSGSRTFVPQVKKKDEPSSQAGTAPAYDSNSRTFVPQVNTKSAAVEPPAVSPAAPAPGTYDPHTRSIVPIIQPPTSKSKPALDSAFVPQPSLAPGSYDPATRTIVPGVKQSTPDPELAPPPRNPARLSPTNSPRTSYLEHKPSIVREDPDEDAASLDTPQKTRIIQTSAGPAKSYVSTQQHQRSSSLDVPTRNTPSNRGRQVSASPTPSQRKTHFSASPVSPSERHEPPPRDISPAKSALKHPSPAPSTRAASPLAQFSKGPGSDASSLYSQDGLASSGKKKKSVRVSFDEQPHEIDISAAASPKVSSRPRSPILDDLDDEEFSKPRPALPTFGSVRKNREVAEKVTEMAPDRHEHSSDHAVGGILHGANGTTKPAIEPMPPVVTSKDIPGHISDSESTSDVGDLGEYAAANATVVSLPEQTAGQTPQIHDEPKEKTPVEPIVRDFASSASTSQKHDPKVPQINLLPPTPGTEEFKSLDNRHSAEIIVPGGWGAENESEAKVASIAGTAQPDTSSSTEPMIVQTPEEHSPLLAPIDEDTDTDDAEFSDAAEDPSEFEGGFASLDAIAVSPIIVKPSPNVSPVTGTTSPPESPVAQKAVRKTAQSEEKSPDKASGDWTSATAYWSQLSREQRERIERDHMSSDDEARPAPGIMKKTRKTTAKPAAAASSPQGAARSVPAHRDTQPAQPALKKTMRAQPGPAPFPVESSHSMRRSMRDGGGLSSGSLRSRSSSAQPAAPEPRAGSFTKKTMRPQSSGAVAPSTVTSSRVSQDLPSTRPNLSRPPSSASTTRPAPVVSQRLQRELSHDSDSESSFRKKKRNNNGAMTMRSSMRGGPAEQAPPAREQRPSSPDPVRKGKGKDSFSIRSLSPTGSLFGRKKAKDVRDSIRGGSVEPSGRMTTMRTAQPPAKTMRQAPAAAPVQKSSGSRFKSRFADSDDSDDDAPPARRGGGGGFRSRFADSDDEEEVLTPVRGIPRRKGQDDGDSTDLDDSDAEGGRKTFSRGRERQQAPLVPDPADVDKAMEAARKKLGMTSSPPSTPQKQDDAQGSALAQGSLRTSQAPPPSRPQSPDVNSAKKKSFMGGFLRRNRNSQQSVMTVSGLPQNDGSVFAQQQETPTSSPLATRPVQQRQSSYISERPQSPTASPGKLIRRSSNQAQPRQRMVRGDSSYSTATAPPMIGESSWPLGDVPPVPAMPNDVQSLKGDGRPATSDGQGVRFSEDVTSSPGAYSTRTGKKKKFGLLRKAFGLHD